MADQVRSPAPASGATPPPPPVPGSQQAAYAEGAKIGELYGEFDAWVDKLDSLFTSTWYTGGVRQWDRMSPQERKKAMELIQKQAKALPPLPTPAKPELAAALRAGFAERRKLSYEAAKFLNLAVEVACQLAISVVTTKAAKPSPTSIAGIVTQNRDCAAHTASVVIREFTGHDVPAARLVKTMGLPPESMYGFKDAVSYALRWFEELAIKLAERRGGFAPVREGGRLGRYVLFFRRSGGGHVVYGEVAQAELIIIDAQAGKRWDSIWAAERAIGGQLTQANEILNVKIP